MYMRKDPCGIICILITYGAVFYADYVITRWIVLTLFDPTSLWGSFHVIMFNVVITFLTIAHFRAVTSDPGIVPLSQTRVDFSDYHQNMEQEKPFVGPGGDEGAADSDYGPWTVCSRCEVYRPPRAHHCRICKRCVRRMDHHCPWINNCCGEFNQKYFMQFLFYVGILSIYSMSLIIYSWVNAADERKCVTCPKEDMLTKQSRILHSVILMLESMLFGLFVVAIMIDQLSAIFSDETAVEQASKQKVGRSRARKMSKRALMEDVCGKGSMITWIIPCIGREPVNRASNYKFGNRLDV